MKRLSRLRRVPMLGTLMLLAACGGVPKQAHDAGDVDVVRINVPASTGRCELTLSGEIDQYAVQRLSQSLRELEQRSCKERWMVLNAPAGQIGAAVTMGAMLRNRGFHTQVAAGSDCLTACVMVFAAGQQRVLTTTPSLARIGISRVPPDADFGQARCEAEISRAQALTITRYLRAMLPPTTAEAVFHVMAQADCRAHLYWRPSDVMANGLVTRLL